MAQLIRFALLVVASLVAESVVAASGAQATCLHYEPAQVVLVGRLAPLPDGRRLALKLDRPICVVSGSGAAAAEDVRTVKFDFQTARLAPTLAGWAGHRAAISGSLFRGPHDREGELSLLVTGFGRAR